MVAVRGSGCGSCIHGPERPSGVRGLLATVHASPYLSPMPEITARLSTALADRYRIERHLGEGGMATVYLAEDLKHRRGRGEGSGV